LPRSEFILLLGPLDDPANQIHPIKIFAIKQSEISAIAVLASMFLIIYFETGLVNLLKGAPRWQTADLGTAIPRTACSATNKCERRSSKSAAAVAVSSTEAPPKTAVWTATARQKLFLSGAPTPPVSGRRGSLSLNLLDFLPNPN
jgi:hypothetical protein